MAGRFDGLTNSLKGSQIPETTMPGLNLPDNRSRAERREDFEKELAALDKAALIELKENCLI